MMTLMLMPIRKSLNWPHNVKQTIAAMTSQPQIRRQIIVQKQSDLSTAETFFAGNFRTRELKLWAMFWRLKVFQRMNEISCRCQHFWSDSISTECHCSCHQLGNTLSILHFVGSTILTNFKQINCKAPFLLDLTPFDKVRQSGKLTNWSSTIFN